MASWHAARSSNSNPPGSVPVHTEDRFRDQQAPAVPRTSQQADDVRVGNVIVPEADQLGAAQTGRVEQAGMAEAIGHNQISRVQPGGE